MKQNSKRNQVGLLFLNQKKLIFHICKRQYLKSSTISFVLIDHSPCICTYAMDQVLLSIMQVVESNRIRTVVQETGNFNKKQVHEDFDVSFLPNTSKSIGASNLLLGQPEMYASRLKADKHRLHLRPQATGN